MKFDYAAAGRYTPVFVGGAPRSGTTVLHSLVCTSESSNNYVGECSFFTQLVRSLLHGVVTWKEHTRFYFEDHNDFCVYLSSLWAKVLTDKWIHLNCPKILSLKDPLLTPYFHILAQFLADSKFVVCVRDPRDVVASRVEVMRREASAAQTLFTLTEASLVSACNEYSSSYAPVLGNLAAFGSRILCVEYESLVQGKAVGRLNRFLNVADINTDALWEGTSADFQHMREGSQWGSRNYGAPLTSSSVGRYQAVLSDQEAAFVESTCRGTFDALRKLSMS